MVMHERVIDYCITDYIPLMIANKCFSVLITVAHSGHRAIYIPQEHCSDKIVRTTPNSFHLQYVLGHN